MRPNRLEETPMKSFKKNRNERGTAIAELPGALLILFIMIVFPLIAMMSLGFSYGCCATLNNLQLREAVLVAKSEATSNSGTVKSEIVKAWQDSGLGKFVNLDEDPTTDVTYHDGSLDPINQVTDHIVVVTTSCKLKPFLPQTAAILPQIPALNSPVSFVFITERPLENHANYAN
jgi:hypothetical protein